ncbi:MAG: YybS family protein, partial [Actinobacteria bacterium]|nr:YybS family protein [Actinomycetota bacterium]
MSFDKLSSIKTKKVNLGLFILFTFLALVFSFFVPVPGLIGVAVLPIPCALLISMSRIRDGVICASVSCLVLLALDYILAPVAIVLVISVAFIYRSAIENNRTYWQVIPVVFIAFFAAVIIYAGLFSAFYRINFFTETLSGYNTYIDSLINDSFINAYSSLLQLDRNQAGEIIAQMQGVLRFIPRILPGILVVSFAIISGLNYSLSVWFFKRYQIEIRPI